MDPDILLEMKRRWKTLAECGSGPNAVPPPDSEEPPPPKLPEEFPGEP
jgi:hypothetical protein